MWRNSAVALLLQSSAQNVGRSFLGSVPLFLCRRVILTVKSYLRATPGKTEAFGFRQNVIWSIGLACTHLPILAPAQHTAGFVFRKEAANVYALCFLRNLLGVHFAERLV